MKIKNIKTILLVIIIAAVTLAYASSFDGVFLFDDHSQITGNEKISSLSWPWAFMENVRRPVLYLSLALNYAWGQEKVFGYHLFNLAVHGIAALFLFGCISRTYQNAKHEEREPREGMWMAFVVALVWAVHPLQTESVTYIVQRVESLMGMFFFMALYFAIRYMQQRQFIWLMISTVACLLGGLTKEVMLAAPCVVILYDRVFVSASFKEAFTKHKKLYAGLALTWVVMLFLFFTTQPEETPTAGFSFKGISPWLYAFNQPPIILHYLKLVFWPASLVFDYEWLPAQSLGMLWAYMLGTAAILFFLIKDFKNRSVSSFLGLSFFIILAPSSSFIPLKDLAFEHRMYVPLACVVLLVMIGVRNIFWKILKDSMVSDIFTVVLALAIAGPLGFKTYQRNKDYYSEVGMWKDVVVKRPFNSRANNNYGRYLLEKGKVKEARQFYERAIQLNPEYADAHLNMGSLLAQTGRTEEGIAYTQRAIDIDPGYAIAYNNLGAAYADKGEYEKAIGFYHQALDLDFKDVGVYHNLGVALARTGRPYEAIENIEKALALNPDFQAAKEHLKEIKGNLQRLGDSEQP